MASGERVAIFWDYENVRAPSSISGNVLAGNIRAVAHSYGTVTAFRAYVDLAELVSSKGNLRSNLQTSGVSLVDCPHNGRKDVADKMIIVDMLAFAIDHPAPATIILISGDGDFAYALSTLRNRGYDVVLIAPKCASASIKCVASQLLDWDSDVLARATNAPSVLWARQYRTLADLDEGSDPPVVESKFDRGVPEALEESLKQVPTANPVEKASMAKHTAGPGSPHTDSDGMQGLRHSILPWTLYGHLLPGCRPPSPASSDTAASENSLSSSSTSASSVITSPTLSPATQSPIIMTSSVVLSPEHPVSPAGVRAEVAGSTQSGSSEGAAAAGPATPGGMEASSAEARAANSLPASVPTSTPAPSFPTTNVAKTLLPSVPMFVRASSSPAAAAELSSSPPTIVSPPSVTPPIRPVTVAPQASVSTATRVPARNPGASVPDRFRPLVQYLEHARRSGKSSIEWVTLATEFWPQKGNYERAGTRKFRQYMNGAVNENIVNVTAVGTGYVSLQSRFHGATF